MRKNLLLVAAVLVCVGAVGALGYLLLTQGPLAEARHKAQEAPSMEAMARRFHTGEPPCLRYQADAEVPEAELVRVASVFAELGLSVDQTADLMGAFLRWGVDREAGLHARSEEDEWTEVFTEHMPLTGRIVFWWKQEQFRQMIATGYEKHYAEGAAALEKLTPAQQERVHALWKAHPGALHVSNLLKVLYELRRSQTQAGLEVLARALKEHVHQGAPVPESLDALTGLAHEALRDAWGNDFAYDPEIPGGVRLFSFGSDGIPGGEGEDADLVQDVVLDPEAVEAAQPEADTSAASTCVPVPSDQVVSRAEYDGTLERLDQVAPTARIVPAFEDGKATGFKLFAIQPGSAFARIGLCDGDVVKTVAGLPLTSPENALEVYSRLKGARAVPIQLRRQGADYTFQLRIQ
jgi:hypothetical protein